MDLYNLHRPSPAQQQQAAPQPPQGTTTDSALLQALAQAPHATSKEDFRAELAVAQRHVAHWRKETERMDRIARDALDKLDEKKQAKRALKAQLADVTKDADTWRTRYRELSEAMQKSKAPAPDARLEQAERRLREIEQERPEVQQKLVLGGQAFRELQALKPAKAASDKVVAELRAELAKLRAIEQAKAASDQAVAELRAELAKLRAAEPAGRIRELELEVVAGKDKLRAAAQEASGQAVRLLACTDMLARAEQVLKTCSQLQAAKGSEASAALAEALAETTANVAQFLESVKKPAAR
jgi:hypothetical protein